MAANVRALGTVNALLALALCAGADGQLGRLGAWLFGGGETVSSFSSPMVFVMEEHQHAGPTWQRAWQSAAARGHNGAGATVVHFDSHDDLAMPFAGDVGARSESGYANPWAVRNDAFIVESFVRGAVK
eukprot:SAG11_NODE_21631_length_421_cov_1.344720_1_plen_128_part_10